MGNQDVGGVGYKPGVHPCFEEDEYGLGLKYDTPSEPEAEGQENVQPQSIEGSALYATAVARGTDLPIFAKIDPTSHDLISPAPKSGNAPRG